MQYSTKQCECLPSSDRNDLKRHMEGPKEDILDGDRFMPSSTRLEDRRHRPTSHFVGARKE